MRSFKNSVSMQCDCPNKGEACKQCDNVKNMMLNVPCVMIKYADWTPKLSKLYMEILDELKLGSVEPK